MIETFTGFEEAFNRAKNPDKIRHSKDYKNRRTRLLNDGLCIKCGKRKPSKPKILRTNVKKYYKTCKICRSKSSGYKKVYLLKKYMKR